MARRWREPAGVAPVPVPVERPEATRCTLLGVLQVTGDLLGPLEVPVSEVTVTFEDVVRPIRAEFAVCPVTGQLAGRRSGRLARLLRGLAVLGCVQGQALLTPAATGVHHR
jgi:hypothetical protein